MKIDKAFSLFNLLPGCTASELATTYRALAKQFHPDRHPQNIKQATEMMHLINQAYNTIQYYIESKGAQARPNPDATEAPPQPRSSSDSSRPSGGHVDTLNIIPNHWAPLIDAMLDAVFLYYQYGLQNVHLRTHGVGRTHYRRAVHKMTVAIARLQVHSSDDSIPGIALYLQFARYFLDSMQISRYYRPSNQVNEANAYRHYHNGSVKLDLAIKNFYFRELSSRRERLLEVSALETSHQALTTALIKYVGNSWTTEINIKLNLLKAFQKVHSIIFQ